MNEQIRRHLFFASFSVVSAAGIIACTTGTAAPAPTSEAAPATIDVDDEDTIPCAPRVVLQRICQQCHTQPPRNGAPFPLVTRSNILRVGPDGEIRKLMIEQIEAGYMPLSPVKIDYDSRETLLSWLSAGAPAEAPHACDAKADAAVDAGTRGPRDAGGQKTQPEPEPPIDDASVED